MRKTLPGPGPARPGPEEDDADDGTSFRNSPGRVRQHAQGPRYAVRGNPSLRILRIHVTKGAGAPTPGRPGLVDLGFDPGRPG